MARTEEHMAVFRRFVEEVPNKGNFAAADELLHPDVVYHVPGALDPLRGPEGVKAMVAGVRDAFGDLRVSIDELLGAEDWLVARVSVTGTNTGDFGGIGATGRTARWSAVHILRFAEGRIVEDRITTDRLAQLEQLGLVPSAQPSAR